MTPQSNSFLVANCGDGSLNWTGSAHGNSPWLSLVPDSGEASTSGTPVTVMANPNGMTSGDYYDTVVVNGVGVSTQVTVPVHFIIHDCTPSGIVADQVYSDTLNGADCEAPHRSGEFGQVFQYQGTTNDVVSIEVNSDFDGYVVLDTSLTKPALAESDDCIGQPGSPCLPYVTLPKDGLYFIEVTSHIAGDTGLFTVEVAHPRPPNEPDSLDQRLDATRSIPMGGTIGQNSVILRAIVSDPDLADTLHLEAEVVPNSGSFTGIANYSGSDTVLNGQPAHVSVTGLTNHQAYKWRVRAVDQTNRTSLNWVAFGGNPDFDIAVSQPPANVSSATLSQFQANDSVSSYGVGAVVPTDTIVLAGQVSDPDPGDMVRLMVEVQPVSTPFNGTATDSSAPYSGSGSGSFAKVRVGPLPNNTNYHWQAWAEDQTGRVSASKTSFGSNLESATDFRIQVAHPPDLPQSIGQFQSDLTPILVGGTANQGSVVFQGTVSDIDGGTVSMNVEVQPVGTPFNNTASGTSTPVASGQVASLSLSSPTIQNGQCYHWQAQALDNTTRTSNWTSFGANPETANDFCVALPVSQIVFTVNPPASTQAGSPFNPAPQVTARNSLGQTVTSFTGAVTITIANNAGPGGTLSGTTTLNAVAGVATFPGLSIDKVGNGYTLQAAAAGFNATSTPFNITPGPVTKLAFTVQPTSASAGVTITPAVQVAGQDNFGNLVNTFTGQVTLTITPGTGNPAATLTGGGPIAAVAGVAQFSGLSIDKTGANYTLKASSGTLIQPTSNAFSITGGPIASLQFNVPPSTTTAGAAITPAVQVTALDAGGNVANFNGLVTLAIGTNPSGGTLIGTKSVNAVGGVATFTDLHIQKAGVGYTLTASATGAPTIPSGAFNINAGVATQLIFTVQPNTTADSAIIDSVGGVQVTAFDSTGVNIATTFTGQVRMSITPGTGTAGAGLFGTVNKNATGGVAQFTDLRINKLGTNYQLTATATGLLSDDSSPFNIIVGPAKALFFTVDPPASTVANVAMNPAVKVTARDAGGNTVTAFNGSVTLTITSGTGTPGAILSGGVVSASSGVATFSNLSIDRAGTGYTLTASSGALTQDVSTPFTILAGGPDGTKSTISPTSPITACKTACAGGNLSTVTVTARDAANNPVSGATVTISSSSPSAVVTQPAGLTNGSGVATGTISDTTAGPQSVSATITLNPNPPANPTAANLTVNPAAAAATFFIRNPLSTTAGATINNPGTGIQVQVNDQFGNKVSTATNNVGLTILVPPSPAGGVLAGAPNPKAAVSGVATFSNLSIAQANNGYFLLATGAGLAATDTSTPFNIIAGVATKLSITTQPSTSAQSGVTLAQQPAIQLLDALNNPVSQSGVVITATINSGPGGGSVINPTATTNASGLATFSGLAISGTAGSYTLHFASGSLTAVNSSSIALSAGAAAKLSITTQPSTSAQSGIAIAQQPAIQLLDGSDNPVSQSGIVITATINSGPGGGSVINPTATTNASGLATFSGLAISGTAG
ncbi:MAG TPA: Ig-like domain-containing protein, partial [Gemmatimonadales bacterium]|nr:Ig-like domain-containing protein [Gemmatimonadales bacterium]